MKIDIERREMFCFKKNQKFKVELEKHSEIDMHTYFRQHTDLNNFHL